MPLTPKQEHRETRSFNTNLAPEISTQNAKNNPNIVCTWKGESGNTKKQYLNTHIVTLYPCGAVSLWDTDGIHLVPLKLELALL